MATHDYVIDNQSAPNFRSDLNSALSAIVTTNSNSTAPSTTYANMLWYDTANNQIKKRNEANSAWIILGTVDEGNSKFTPNAAITTTEIAATTLVTESDTIASNDNDTTFPTSAAVDAHIPVKLNASGSAPIFAARAWVSFDGTTTPPTINGSGNVSSVSRISTGRFLITFTTAMQDTNYAFIGTARENNNVGLGFFISPAAGVGKNTTDFGIDCWDADAVAAGNSPEINLVVFR